MLFGLHVHDDSHISLWIAPDDQRVVPRIKLTLDETTAVVTADVHDVNVKNWGWHSTGLCGFAITEAAYAGMAQAGTLEIRDYETNILLYRKSRLLGATQRRLFFLDHTLAQSNPLRDLLFPHFQISHLTLRNLSQSVLNCLIGNPSLTSQLCCGAICYPAFESYFVEQNFLKIFLAHDPYIELASRILWLRKASELALSTTNHWQIEELLDPCYFASSLELDKPPLLRKAFKALDPSTTKFLSNPMTRYLGARDDREWLHPGHWSTAIQNLSRFDIVGHDDYPEEFTASVLQALGLPPQSAPRPVVPASVRDLAAQLRSLKAVIPLVEMDLDLSDRIRSLVEKFWK